MGKIIIQNNSSLDDMIAIDRVQQVMRLGRISETSAGRQYCFVSTFSDVDVAALKNKKSDRFVVQNRER